jgi:transcriptional regulator with GAF, ATPase, and Fis domain
MMVTSDAGQLRSESRDAYFDVSFELLRAMAHALDIRTVLPRLSDIIQPLLPHDAVAVVCRDERGHAVVEAAPGEFAALTPPGLQLPPVDDLIIRDLAREALPVPAGVTVSQRLVASGYRSMVGVSAWADSQMFVVAFWSKQPEAFGSEDLPLARRIAGHLALGVAHEPPAREAGPAARDQARAERIESRGPLRGEDRWAPKPPRIVGESAEWQEVLRKATQVATTDTTVLITGESGTGKEVVARFVHRASARRNGPFVALNCAALPEQLLESELFGYERGAFTSAQQAKPGQIEMAAGGVLFLDEVSEMSLAAQAKFLRVLQEREFQRLGATRAIKANVRVVAATNRDLRKAVERGTFREDLFYRLQVFDIPIAPLRERRGDILPLAGAFLEEIAPSLGRPPAVLAGDARQALVRHDWPGNVRELRNALERAAILSEGGPIEASHLALQPSCAPARVDTTNLKAFERDTIAQVLRQCRWNKAQAALRLGLTRTQLYVRIRKYGLEPTTLAETSAVA